MGSSLIPIGAKLETVIVNGKTYYKINNKFFTSKYNADQYVINAMQGIGGPYIGEIGDPSAPAMPATPPPAVQLHDPVGAGAVLNAGSTTPSAPTPHLASNININQQYDTTSAPGPSMTPAQIRDYILGEANQKLTSEQRQQVALGPLNTWFNTEANNGVSSVQIRREISEHFTKLKADFANGITPEEAAQNNTPLVIPGAGVGTGGAGSSSTSSSPDSAPSSVDYTDFIKKVVKNYAGKDATAADIAHWNGMLNSGTTQNQMLVEVANGSIAQDFQNRVMAGDNHEFDAIVNQIFQDYAGVDADDASKRIHGAALKGGMSIEEFRDMMKTANIVQAHIASDPVTADEVNHQNSLMTEAVQASAAAGTYVPAQNTDAMATPAAPSEPAPAPNPTPNPAPAAVVPPPTPDVSMPAQPAAPARRVLLGDAAFVNEVYRSYLGRDASDMEIAAGVGQIAGGKSHNQFQIDVVNSPESIEFQNKVLANGGNDFEAVVDQVFQDYAGVNADDASKRIHGAALKNGMSIDELREDMKKASVVQQHIAGNAVTDDEINRQNTLMAQAVQTASSKGAYKAVAVSNFNPITGGFSTDNGTGSMPAAVPPQNNGIPGP